MKVIVFGGSGFIGSHTADALTEAGHEVKIFDLKLSSYLRSGQEMIIGDILNFDQVSEVIQGSDVVYNFAGLADLDDATTKPIETVRENIEGNVNLLEASQRANINRFIYASTIYVYSQLGGFYRCSKQSSELYIEEYLRNFGLNYTILRYGTVYGPRADSRNSVYRYLYQALKYGHIEGLGTGEEIREYIHVHDVARLSVEILKEEYINHYVIITGRNPMKYKELLNMIKEILNNKVQIKLRKPKNYAHYNITPYSFAPKIGKKLVSNYYQDIGQGLLECLEEIYQQLKKK